MLKLKSRLKTGAAFVKDRHGGAAIMMGVLTPVIIGGLAFGVEVGGWELTKRQLQNAADVSAFAAATQVRSGEDNATIESAAEAVAADSGYTGGAGNLDLEYPPSTSPNAVDGTNPNGNSNYVYVTLNQDQERLFTKFFSNGADITFTYSALAKIENGRPACVLALHPTATAVEANGSATIELTGCDVASNSMSSTAVAVSSPASMSTNCVSAVGGVGDDSGLNLTECDEAIENAPVTADPYRNVPAPTSCTSTNSYSQFPNQGSGASRCYTGSAGTISLNDTTLTSNTTYIFKNTSTSASRFKVNGNKTLTGTNVTLYFEGTWDIEMNGTATVNLTAPVTGPYKGIAIWGDRNSDVDMDFSGNNGAKIVGAIYSPNKNSNIIYTGSSVAYSAGECTQVIGGTVTFTGNADFSTDCTNSGTTAIMAGQTIQIVG